MKKILTAIVLSATIIVFLLGFIQFGKNDTNKSTADVMYSINDIPENLINVGRLSKRQQDIICAVSKGLIEIDIDGDVFPSLAESVDISEDGIQYEFTIRDDVYWSNGNKITSKDIVTFFRQILTVENEQDIQALLNVYGAREYREGNKNFSEVVALYATDNKVVFRLNSPDNNFLTELAKPQYRVREDAILWDDLKKQYMNFSYTGDYKITLIENEKMVLTRNNKSDNELPQTINIVEDDSEDSALAAFEIGNRDIVVNPPRTELRRLKEEGKLITLPSNNAVYLNFNLNNQFISIDGRKTIYLDILNALDEYSKRNPSAMTMSEYSYLRGDSNLELQQSRKVLTNTHENWQNDNNVALVLEKNVANKELVNIISSWFEKNTDISLIIRLIDKDEIDSIIQAGNYDIALINLEAAEENKEQLYEEVIKYLPDTAMEVWSSEENTLEDQLFNNYSILPLIFYNENIAVNNGVKGVVLDGNGNIRFTQIRK